MKEIRSILKAYTELKSEGKRFSLATVVNVEESSYRRIGARMLVCEDGRWFGGISGGCLEGDALQKSQKAIYNNKVSSIIYNTLDDDNSEIGVGLGCNGKIEVLVTPLDSNLGSLVVDHLFSISNTKEASILLKIIKAPQESNFLGQEYLVSESTEAVSFCDIDMKLLQNEISNTRINRRPQVITISNKTNQQLRVLVEYIRPDIKLIVVGDNYDVLALIGIANELGWEIHIVGRKKKMSKSIFNIASKVYEYEDIMQVPQGLYSALILMTHDFEWDKKLIPEALQLNLRYIGMLGPKKRLAKMNEELKEIDLKTINHFHSPVGLDIGAETPEEIAASIVAEIIAIFRNREGASHKFRDGTIHNRY